MNSAPDLATAAIKMLFSLGVVLLIVWGLYRLAKGKLPSHAMGGKTKYIQVVDSQYLGVKKSVVMVKIPGSILVLGVGADNVNLLTQINDPDIVNSISVNSKKQRILGFKDQLNRLTKPQSKGNPDIYNEKTVVSSWAH
jgi:flagellar biogenesis protein FliO